MTLQEQFAAEIEAFIKARDIKPTDFGKRAIGDPNFVADLRGGRSPNLRTIERVREFMDGEDSSSDPPQSEARGAA